MKKLFLWNVLFIACLFSGAFAAPVPAADPSTAQSAAPGVPTGKEMYVYFLDVGQGDSIFIHTPNGKNILIDAGPVDEGFDAGKEIVLPFLRKKNVKRIDTIVASHAHGDHIGGLPSIMEELPVGEVLDTGFVYPSPFYEKFLKTINAKKIPYRIVQKDDVLKWDPDLSVKVLSPRRGHFFEDPNNNSIVIRMVYKNMSFMFAGDAEDLAEYEIISNYKKSDLASVILKVPHHGSHTSSTDVFLEAVQPEVGVIMAGRFNRFHLPNKAILKRYADYGIELHRTDTEGTIFITTDGETYALKPLGFK